jgi:hypothetical protein
MSQNVDNVSVFHATDVQSQAWLQSHLPRALTACQRPSRTLTRTPLPSGRFMAEAWPPCSSAISRTM